MTAQRIPRSVRLKLVATEYAARNEDDLDRKERWQAVQTREPAAQAG